MAERCYECGCVSPHAPWCTKPLEVRRFPGDTPEEARAAIALERCNAGAAQSLLDRGMNPHTYSAGSST